MDNHRLIEKQLSDTFVFVIRAEYGRDFAVKSGKQFNFKGPKNRVRTPKEMEERQS
jgi:hypothetical protein